MSGEQRYPLAWPPGRPRTAATSRKGGQFGKKGPQGGIIDLTVLEALARLEDETTRLGARDPLLSTNLVPSFNGAPKAGQPNPADPGVALYFTLAGKPHCMPCDTYLRAADNIAALAAHINATRAIARYGVTDIAAMFTGFLALPPAGQARPWLAVFGYSPDDKPTFEQAEARYRQLARERHPDTEAGSDAMMAELNAARDAARRDLAVTLSPPR